MNHELHWTFDDLADEQALEEHEVAVTEHQEAVQERDRAIEKAGQGANPLWVEEALTALKAVARFAPELTSEDVADQLELSTPEPRALGAVFLVAKNQGWIEPTDRFVPATHPSRHMAPIRVWASRIFVERAA